MLQDGYEALQSVDLAVALAHCSFYRDSRRLNAEFEILAAELIGQFIHLRFTNHGASFWFVVPVKGRPNNYYRMRQ